MSNYRHVYYILPTHGVINKTVPYFVALFQNFPQSHQLITTLNGSVPTTQTLTITAALNNISSSAGNNYVVSEDEISKKLPKEILLRILSYLDVVSLCRCAQVSEQLRYTRKKFFISSKPIIKNVGIEKVLVPIEIKILNCLC